MNDTLLYLYLANAVLLTVHEMDSVHWREWDMFRMPGGVSVFLLLHAPLLGAVFYGLVLLARGQDAGLWFSFVLCSAGVFAFFIHTWFIRRGHPAFRSPVSQCILWAALGVSLVQGYATWSLLPCAAVL